MACKLNAGFCKVGLVLVVGFSLFLWGCSSVPTDSIDPAEIEYQEMDAKDYCDIMSQYEGYSSLFWTGKGCIIADVYIVSAETKDENGVTKIVVGINDRRVRDGREQSIDVTDCFKEMAQIDPTFADRMDSVDTDERFNGKYKFWVYGVEEGDWWNGYTRKVILHKIEGIPTQEEIDAVIAEQAAEEAAAEAERIAQEEAEKRAKAEKIEQLNARGRQLAKGYTFHGIEEDELSCKLFTNGALEPGHAYLISGFVVQYGGSYAAIEYGDGFFFSSRSSSVIVSYASQQVKAEIINAGVTSLLGQTIETPLTVVVAAGTGYSGTPVVLGLVEE
jgi:hypothetical protein